MLAEQKRETLQRWGKKIGKKVKGGEKRGNWRGRDVTRLRSTAKTGH